MILEHLNVVADTGIQFTACQAVFFIEKVNNIEYSISQINLEGRPENNFLRHTRIVIILIYPKHIAT